LEALAFTVNGKAYNERLASRIMTRNGARHAVSIPGTTDPQMEIREREQMLGRLPTMCTTHSIFPQ
jgi:hypothetical protein